MEIGGNAACEQADMVGRDLLGAPCHTQVAHDAFDEQLAGLAKTPLARQFHPQFNINALGTGLETATAMTAMTRLGKDAVELALHIPGVLDLVELIMMVGWIGKDSNGVRSRIDPPLTT